MAFELSVNGMYLPLDTQEYRERLEKRFPLREVERLMVRESSHRFHGTALSHWDWRPQLKLGQYFYPTGAARWSEFNTLITSSQRAKLLKMAYRNGLGSAQNGLQFKMRCDARTADAGFYTYMYALPTRPLLGVSGNQEGTYLLTLVDERYYFQFKNAGAVNPTGTSTTWASLLTTLATALGITLTQGTISSTYGYPHEDSPLWSNYENAAVLLDIAAWNVGKLVVRKMDGTYELQTPSEAGVYTILNKTGIMQMSGGDAHEYDAVSASISAQAVLPSSVTVAYPKFVTNDNFYDTRDQRDISRQSWGSAYTKEILISATGAATTYAGHTGTITFHDTCRAYYSDKPPSTLTNGTFLDALALQLAEDYYQAQLNGWDVAYPGIYPWIPEGLNDILWDYHTDEAHTRVFRKPWNWYCDEFAHTDGTDPGTWTQQTSFLARLSNESGNGDAAYGWVEVEELSPGTYQDKSGGRTGDANAPVSSYTNPAYEMNNHEGLPVGTQDTGLIVRMYEHTNPSTASAGIDYQFDGAAGASGSGGGCCCDWWVWLRMEESSGDAQDSSGSQEHFTEYNGAIAGAGLGKVDMARKVLGQAETAVSVYVPNSLQQHFSRPHNSNWDIQPGKPRMYSAWVMPLAAPSLSGSGGGSADFNIYTKPALGSGTTIRLWLDNSGGVRFNFGGATTSPAGSPGAGTFWTNYGLWYWVCAWYDPLAAAIYCSVNNHATIAVAGGVANVNSSALNYIGWVYQSTAADGPNMYIDEVLIADIAPTFDQRADLYNNGAGSKLANCWKGSASQNPTLYSSSPSYGGTPPTADGVAVNAQTGTTYTVLSTDRKKLVTHTNAGAIAVTLPQATGAFGADFYFWMQNRGAGTVTITPTTSTIDGAASLTRTTGQGALIVSDGTNWFTSRGG